MSQGPNETTPTAEPPPDESHAGTTDDHGETQRGIVERLGGYVIGMARPLLALFGLAGFTFGAIIAWRAESATALLIVSAILLVLAALGLDWSEIRGSYGSWTIRVLREVEERLGQAAASEEIPPPVRAELESLRAQVEAATPPARTRRSQPLPLPDPSSSGWREMFQTTASHSFRGMDAVELTLRSVVPDGRFTCTVKTATGNAYRAVTRRPLFAGIGFPMAYKVVYPDDFPSSEPLTPGRYEVEWRPAPLEHSSSPGSEILNALTQVATKPIATDSFTIPEMTERSAQ